MRRPRGTKSIYIATAGVSHPPQPFGLAFLGRKREFELDIAADRNRDCHHNQHPDFGD